MNLRIQSLWMILALLLGARTTFAAEGLRTLYVTDFNNGYHDYDATQKVLQKELRQKVNLDIVLVGRQSQETLDLLKKPGFLDSFDLFIYNACFADNTELDLLRNLNREIASSGVPTVFLHCAMHNFRWSSEKPGVYGIGKKSRLLNEWKQQYPSESFPAFWKLSGMDSVNHDAIGSFVVTKVSDHPITRFLPATWNVKRDERYQTQDLAEGVEPLLVSGPHTIAWLHRFGKARIVATTLGHDENTQNDPLYIELLNQGIRHITGVAQDPAYNGHKIASIYSGSIACYPREIVEPKTREDVQAALRFAAERQLKIKAISIDKPNSYSEILCPEKGGLLLNLKHLNRLIAVDKQTMTAVVEPGMTVDALGKALHEKGLSFATTADYTGITIAGGIATAAHHSSLNIAAAMSEYVEGLEILDANGNFQTFVGQDARNYATHLGVLGVVTRITLRVEPEFKLKYGYESGNDNGLEQFIETAVRRHSYARVSWFAGAGRYVLEYFDKVAPSEAGDSVNNLWSSTASAFRLVGNLPYSAINAGPRALQCTGEALRSRVWLPPVQNVGSASSENPVGFAYNMLGSSCEAGSCPWDFGAKNRSIEAALPLSQLKSWMQDVRAIQERDRGCFPVLGIYLRFSPAGSSWMSMAYGEDMVMFEIHIPSVDKQDIFEQSASVYDEILQLALIKYKARPHWGKNNRPVFTGTGALYPQWSAFQALQKRMDPNGLFTNEFFHSLQGKDISRTYPACARSHECSCQTDEDCGTGYSCESGVSFGEAKVCRKR